MSNDLAKDAGAGSKVKDIIGFIFHKIVAGYIFWITMCYFVSYQQFIVRTHKYNSFLGFLSYMSQYIIVLYFFRTTVDKDTRKPFKKLTDIVSAVIMIATCLIMYLIFGIKTVVF